MPHESATEFRIQGVARMGADACILILEEVGGARLLPIYTGIPEAEAIARHVAGVKAPRPMTHDLLHSIIASSGWTVSRVVVNGVEDGVFHSRIDFARGAETMSVDARPSDALNVAARAGCPIQVDESVLDEAEPILKPIAAGEVERFREELATVDPSAAFAALEGKSAPKERGAEDAA